MNDQPKRFTAEDYRAMSSPFTEALFAAAMGKESAADLAAMLRQAAETEEERERYHRYAGDDSDPLSDALHYANEELKTLRIMVGHFNEGHRQADVEIVRIKAERDTLAAQVKALEAERNKALQCQPSIDSD